LFYNGLGIYVFKFISSDAVDNRILPGLLIQPLSYVQWNEMIGTVVGYAAFLLAAVGCFLLANRKARAVALGCGALILFFGLVFVYYFTTHDYYHLPLILPVCIGLAGLAQALLPKLAELIHPGWLAGRWSSCCYWLVWAKPPGRYAMISNAPIIAARHNSGRIWVKNYRAPTRWH